MKRTQLPCFFLAIVNLLLRPSAHIFKMDEYETSKRLRVIYTPAHTSSSAGDNPGERSEIDLELEILRAYTPFTTSVVCLVRIISLSTSPPVAGLPETCVLKLYDRRYAINARETFDAGRLYSAAKEAAYQRFLQAAVADPSIEEKTIWQLSEEEDEGGVEAYLERSCQKQYIAEMGAYGDLAELQGTLIPTLYGSVRYRLAAPLPSSSPVGGTPSPIRYGVNGILIAHIPSTTLEAYLTAAMQSDPIPYDYISDVCDQVIKLMDRLDNFKVLNQDCGMRNILVVSDGKSVHNVLIAHHLS